MVNVLEGILGFFGLGGFLIFGLVFLWYIEKTNKSKNYRFKHRVVLSIFIVLTAAPWLWMILGTAGGDAGWKIFVSLFFLTPTLAVIYTVYIVISFIILRVENSKSNKTGQH